MKFGRFDTKMTVTRTIGTLLWIICYFSGTSGQFDSNFTLQSVWGRLQSDSRSITQCHADENYKKIRFSRKLDTGQGSFIPKSFQQFMQGKPVYARILFMPGDDKLNRFGAFQCKIIKDNVATEIVTLKLPPSELAELDAVNPYLRASMGSDLELEVTALKEVELPVRWRHNGVDLPEWNDKLKVEIKDIKLTDAGIYECFYVGRRNEGVHALIRVIVKKCPNDNYGDQCDQECPPCYNGGICHDTWGECVCPAGFTGTNCEVACGGNRFGADCSKFCSPPQNNSNTDELCASHLFCKPDPYGCSCAPGFKGSSCMEHCEPGWYGADCEQPCHCAFGSASCNRITGACSTGVCARGWRGNSCEIEDPNAISVETTSQTFCPAGWFGASCEKRCHCAEKDANCDVVTGLCPNGCEEGFGGPSCMVPDPVTHLECQSVDGQSNLLLVSWEPPSEVNGIIRGYVINCTLVDRGHCEGVQNRDKGMQRQLMSIGTKAVVLNLHPYSLYKVSVQARTSAGESEPVFTYAATSEGEPDLFPPNVRALSCTSRSLGFGWDSIPCDRANGIITRYAYRLLPPREIRKKRSPDVPLPEAVTMLAVEGLRVEIKDLEPGTEYGFRVAGVNRAGIGPFSDVLYHKTLDDIPGVPRNLAVMPFSPNDIGLTWSEPEVTNGRVSKYRINVRNNETSELVADVTYSVRDGERLSTVIGGLTPATVFAIQIQARTSAGWGNYCSPIYKRTYDGIPDEPLDLSVSHNGLTTLNLTWKEPARKNGRLLGYKITYRAQRTLDPVFNATSFADDIFDVKVESVLEVSLSDLHPSTEYQVSVQARTSAGYGTPAKVDAWTVILGLHNVSNA